MKKEDMEFKEKMKTKVATLLNQLEVFNKDLDKNESVDIGGLSLISSKTKLDNSLKELKQLHCQRKEERNKLEEEVSLPVPSLLQELFFIFLPGA